MFVTPRTIITQSILIAGLLLPGLAQADIQACFHFLDAQDYARAESEAKRLLQNGHLDRIDEFMTQLCLGRAYSSMGRAQDALPAFQRMEAMSQTTMDLDMGIAYNWLSSTYFDLNDLDRAELYGQRALKAYHELGFKPAEAITLNNLAGIANHRGDTERALKLYRESLPMLPDAEQATTLNNIALIHSDREEYPQAIEMLRQAIAIDRSNGDAHATAQHQINLGGVLRQDKQYAAAGKELLAGLNSIRLVGDKHWEASACEGLANLAVDAKSKPQSMGWGDWIKKAEALYREIGDNTRADRIARQLAGK